FIVALQPDDRPHQHGLARARPAHDADDLAAPHLKVEVFVDHLFAEAVAQPGNADHGAAAIGFLGHQFHPVAVKKTAKNASIPMTRKSACTGAAVGRRPPSSALPRSCMPWKQPVTAITSPNTGALMRPTHTS